MLPDVNENGVFYGRGTGKARVSFRLRVCPAERPRAGQRCSPRYGFDSVSVSVGLRFVKWCGQWSQLQSCLWYVTVAGIISRLCRSTCNSSLVSLA